MRVCIFGAGAVGGHLAVRLANAGHEVSCVLRGAALDAVQANGLKLRTGDRTLSATVAASDEPARLGVQDLVICTLKATGLAAFADGAMPLLGPETPVIAAQNGIPWWYARGLSNRPAPPNLVILDPGGRLARVLPEPRLIGGVIFSSNAVVSPGVIVNDSPERNALVIGELDDSATPRLRALRGVFEEAGIGSPAVPDIRHVLWSKLVSNMTFSVLCMLTGQTVRALWEDPALQPQLGPLLAEAMGVAMAHNPGFQRFSDGATAPPDHKPSLLMDLEQRRPLEIDALVTAPQAFARHAGLDTPRLDLLAALATQRARAVGLY